MNSLAQAYADWQEFGCQGCRDNVIQLGPVLGPELPPALGIERWSMTPAEWAGAA